MSLASYIGCNIELPISEDEFSGNALYIGECFASDEELQNVRHYQFTTPYVYEVSSHWGIEIMEDMNQETRAESKNKLLELCARMKSYLTQGDYFELYSCWVGEETRKREGEITLEINCFNINQIQIPEKTLVRIEK